MWVVGVRCRFSLLCRVGVPDGAVGPLDERRLSAWSGGLVAHRFELSVSCYPFGLFTEQLVRLSDARHCRLWGGDTPGQQILSVYKVAPKLSENRFCRSGLFRCFQNALFPFLTVLQVIGID